MSNKLAKTIFIGLLIVLVMSLGAFAVFAQDDVTPDDTPAAKTMPYGHRGGFHGKFQGHGARGAYGGANDEAMADALGITVEELQEAHQKIAADRLAQAVEEGLLTQDAANLMLAKMALKEYLDQKAIMAEAFGLTVAELEAAREKGELRELFTNTTPAELKANMQAAVEKALAQAVTDEVITQNQADLVLEQMANGLEMRGNYGGHHSFGGPRGGSPDFHGFRGAPRNSGAGDAFAPFGRFQNFDA